jgi:hypothetical protein
MAVEDFLSRIKLKSKKEKAAFRKKTDHQYIKCSASTLML